MAVRLRAHHLLCMLTHAGHGYGAAFVENFGQVLDRIGEGETVLVIAGPDDVCAPLLEAEDKPHCLKSSVTARDDHAVEAVSALLGTPAGPGARLTLDAALIGKLRRAFMQGEIRHACAGCEWVEFCDRIVASDFNGTRLPHRQST